MVLVLAVVGGVDMARRGVAELSPTPQVAEMPSAADTRFRPALDSDKSAEVTAKRLSEELYEALRKEVPEARWVSADAPRDSQRPPYDFEVSWNGGAFVRVWSGLLNDNRRGSLEAMIIAPGGQLPRPGLVAFDWSCLSNPEGHSMCDETDAPSGAKMKVVTRVERGYVRHTVDINLPGDQRLHLSVSNEPGGAGSRPVQLDAPLYMEQAVALGLALEREIQA